MDGRLGTPGDTTSILVIGGPGLNLGENGPAGDDQLIGALDDVRIYDAEWSHEKVLEDRMWGRRGADAVTDGR